MSPSKVDLTCDEEININDSKYHIVDFQILCDFHLNEKIYLMYLKYRLNKIIFKL